MVHRRGAARNLAAQHVSSPLKSDRPAGRQLEAMVEVFLPPDLAPLSESDRTASIQRAAAFVQGQLEALPLRLYILFRLGTVLFGWVTLLRFFTRYSAIPIDRRRRWTELFAFGPFEMARHLFHPVRATALVALYADPVIRRAMEARTRPEQ